MSGFVTDDGGVQLARVPESGTTGRNYKFQDYFHGRGRDLAPASAVGLAPIGGAHRSIVFRSEATANLMVAFSVPIRDDRGDAAGSRPCAVPFPRRFQYPWGR